MTTTPAKAASRSVAFEVWNVLPSDRQTYPELVARLKELGYRPTPRPTFYRWLKEASATPPEALKPDAPLVIDKKGTHPPIDIPVELEEALGLRVLYLARTECHDGIEKAIVTCANEIAQTAPQMAKALLEPETENETTTTNSEAQTITGTKKLMGDVGMKSVMALERLAAALHQVTVSRTLLSMAYRNFGEGDQLSGMGARLKAEAENIRESGRAERARIIDGAAPGAGGPSYAAGDDEDDAVAALREVEERK